MKYSSYLKAKDYSMSNVVPAFRQVQQKYELKDNIFYKYANQLAMCGNEKIIDICKGCGTPYFSGANTCKNRFCPICQKQKSLLLFSKVYPKIVELMNLGFYVNIMTFTIKDTEKLSDGLYLLKTAYRNITGKNKIYSFIFKRMFVGGIKSLEVKRGKNSKDWHPHFHVLVIKKDFSEDRKLLNLIWNKELKRLVNNADHTIYEDKIYTNEKLGDVWISSIKDYNRAGKTKAIYECLKYITKYGEDTQLVNDLEELVFNLKNIHSVDSWGILRGIEKDDEDFDLSLANIKEKICKTCGSIEFETLNGITLKELEKIGVSTDLQDFDCWENNYEKN